MVAVWLYLTPVLHKTGLSSVLYPQLHNGYDQQSLSSLKPFNHTFQMQSWLFCEQEIGTPSFSYLDNQRHNILRFSKKCCFFQTTPPKSMLKGGYYTQNMSLCCLFIVTTSWMSFPIKQHWFGGAVSRSALSYQKICIFLKNLKYYGVDCLNMKKEEIYGYHVGYEYDVRLFCKVIKWSGYHVDIM